MEVFIISFLVIAPAEMADKTQLLALLLMSRFRKPLPIIFGMLVALSLSHLIAALVGDWLGNLLKGNTLHWLVGLSLLGAAVWAFIPDKMGWDQVHQNRGSMFLTAFTTFFIAEMGDRTQLATIALAAHYQSLAAVVIGTTLGIMAANAPAVILGHATRGRLPLIFVRALSGGLFAFLSMYELSQVKTF